MADAEFANPLEVIRPELSVVQAEPILEQVQIINEREGGLIEAYIPIDLIDQEEVAVIQEHVIELAESIKQQSQSHEVTGQLTPVLLGHLNDKDKFVIIDGFHRVPAVKLAGSDVVYGTIKTNCTPEDIIDLRIVAANSHKKVKFARIVEWVEEAWQTTPWSNNVGVSQAFVMTFLKGSGRGNGRGNGLTNEDVAEIRQWVRQKCEQWDVNPIKVDQYLRTARVADPELVKSARERTSGHKLEAVTPMHLGQIARHLPNDYPLQHVVARAAINHTLTVPQTQSLSLAVSKARTYEDVDQALESKIWERMSSATKALASKRYKEIDTSRPETYVATLVEKFFDDQIKIAEGLIENAILKGIYLPKSEEVSKRMNDFLMISDVVVEEVGEELPEDQIVKWSPDRVADASEKVMRMQPFLSKMIRRQFPFNEDDAEDIISVSVMRFLDRVSDGRLPETYSDETHLRRLMSKIATNAAIDEIRRIRGRNGQKPTTVSIHAEDEEGRSLENILASDQTGTEESKLREMDEDFIKNLLPFIDERGRRVLVLKAYFGLTSAEIAKVLGTTEGTIVQCFNKAKKKAIQLSEEAQLQVIGMTD